MPAYEFVFDASATSGSNRLLQVLDRIDKNIQKLAQGQQKYGRTVNATQTTINNYNRTVSETVKRQKSWFSSLVRGTGIFNTFNKGVRFLVRDLQWLGNVLGGFLLKGVQGIGGAFERSEATLRVLAAGAGSTAQEVDKLVQKVKDLGRTTEFTSQAAADGAIALLKAGEDATGAMKKLEPALDAALATGLQLNKAAAMGNHAWKIFGENLGKTGKEAKNYTTALKIMVASANAADMTVEQLDRSLINGGNILADLGIPLTRVTTALGLLANRGVTGSKAMRLLAIGTKRLVDGTKPAQAALRELGVSATDSSGQLKDLGVLFEEINQALNLRKPTDQIKLMKNLFGAADKVMRTLLSAGIQGFDELEDSIEKALAVMNKLKEAKADTIIGAWKSFRSAVEGVYVSLVDVLKVPIMEYWGSLAGILNKLTDRITLISTRFRESGRTIDDWIRTIQEGGLSGLFEGFADSIKPELEKLKKIFKALWETVKALGKEALRAVFSEDMIQELTGVGEILGFAIGKGIKAGLKYTQLGADISELVSEGLKGESPWQVFKEFAGVIGEQTGDVIAKMLGTPKEVIKGAQKGVVALAPKPKPSTSIEAQIAKLDEIVAQQAIEATAAKIEEFGGIAGVQKAEEEKLKLSPIEQRHEETKRARAFMTLSPEEKRRHGRRAMLKAYKQSQSEINELTDEEIAARLKLHDLTQRQSETIVKQKNLWGEIQLKLSEMQKSIEIYLINPIDKFQQKILGIRTRFDEVIAGLSERKLKIQEAFQLKPSPQIERERQSLVEKQIALTKKRLGLAQTPEETAALQEKVSGLLEKRAEIAASPAEKKRFAQESVKFLSLAERNQLRAEEQQVKAIEIEKKYAEKQIPLLREMARNAKDSPKQLVEILNQLQANYQNLGMGVDVQQTMQQQQQATLAAVKVEEEHLTLMVEKITRLIEVGERSNELLESQLTEARNIPPPVESITMPE